MKIVLENFRCWENKEVDVGDDSLVLLSGTSGCGKSTVLNAINFAITGEGKNLVTYGKTSCKVSITLGDTTITRSRRPNRLLVTRGESEFEDAVGQEVVNRLFGSLYAQCSYIQQDLNNTFMYMTPSDKLEFLESFAFHNFDIATKKESIKETLRTRQEAHRLASGLFASIKSIFGGMEEPELVKFPLKCPPAEQEEVAEKHLALESSLINKEQKLRQALNNATKHQNRRSYLVECMKALTDRRHDYQEQEAKLVMETSDYYMISCEIQKFEKMLERRKAYNARKELENKVSDMKQQLDDMVHAEKTERADKKASISSRLWPDDSKETTMENIEALRDYLRDMEYLEKYGHVRATRDGILTTEERVKSAEKELDELAAKHSAAVMSMNVYTCPSCSSHLKFERDQLVCYDHEVLDEDPKNIERKMQSIKADLLALRRTLQQAEVDYQKNSELVQKCEDIRSSYDEVRTSMDVKEDLIAFESYLATNVELESQFAKLSVNSESKVVQDYRRKYMEAKEKLDQVPAVEEETFDEDLDEKHKKLCRRLDEIKYQLNRLKDVRKTIDTVLQESRIVETELSTLVVQDVPELEAELKRVSEKLGKASQISRNIAKFRESSKYRRAWTDMKDKYDAAEQNESKASEKLESIILLRDKVVRAESIYLQSIVGKLAENTNKILECFFVDNPMTIEFKAFKQVKKDTKAQINLAIWYKNTDTDLMELSGGERDRLNLAITIALSQTFSSPVLMLDECISSLDSDNFSNVLEYLKENNSFAHIFLVSHQANEGIFDRVVEF
jgi:DNA repair exonuclease SbcCD ATPase subunit